MDDWSYKPAKDLNLPPKERLRSVKREPGLGGSSTHYLWSLLIAGYLRTYHRLRVIGREHLPTSMPFVVVANHSSHLDAVVLAQALPMHMRNCTFPIAAGDTFFEIPALSAFAAYCMNALPIWRKNCGHHAMDELRERLVEGSCGYILFPEGTRSRTGEMGPFKPGLGMLVAQTPTQVIPAYIDGAFDALPPGKHTPRPRKIVVKLGAPLLFADTPNNRTGWMQVAEQSEKAVYALAGR